MSRTVLIIDKFAGDYARTLGERHPELTIYTAASRTEVPADLASIDILVAFGIVIDDDLMGAMTNLKWIQSLATGVDHFLRCSSLKPETILTSGRGIHGPAMRETAAFLMLSLSHEAPRLVRSQDAHVWDRNRPWPLLAGKTAVIVGVGISSSAIATLLKAFGMHVIGLTRTVREADGFDEVLATGRIVEAVGRADYLVNVLPGDERNANLIGTDVFNAMKPEAYFVNIGRGETVDEAALIKALQEKRFAGAGLDVFRSEPLPPDSELWDMPNVLVCPHIGGFFAEYEEFLMPILVENAGLFIEGRIGEMRNIVPH